ncbi:hypothetical protein G5714_024747 [Onychostoma macrolepis]|uniref:Uncharacterized protein n=1 Tax=Onychostoma macrolepis TaxID=369639 RepID=A0A7J6BJU4_9TELE|nr:hypothetical protein G5714_024747 [Onychostoma macrolepis]
MTPSPIPQPLGGRTSRVPGGTLRARPTEPRLRPEGGNRAHPLYPPQGTRTSGRGGRLSYTHSTRLREPGPRAEGGDSLTPTLPASGNQDLGQRGPLSCTPSTRLREPGPRAEGATLLHPLYPPRGTRTSGRGGTVRTPFYSPRTLSSPAASPPRAPPDLQEGPLPRPPFEPGHPTLKPGLLTRPSAPSGEPGHWAPRGRFYHWSPRIDLGFGRLSLGLPGFPGTLSPTHGTTTPARGGAPRTPPPPASGNQTLARRGPLSRTPSATGSPRIDLGFFSGRPSAPATGTPGTPQGVEPRPPGWASSSADKRLDRGKTFNGSQRVSCSATHETLTQNQVVYESFSTGFSTNFRCVSREAALVRPLPVQSRMALRTGRPGGSTGYPRPIRAPRRCGIVTSRRDSDLEAFSHNPTDGSFAPVAPQPNTRTKCLNLRFLSY